MYSSHNLLGMFVNSLSAESQAHQTPFSVEIVYMQGGLNPCCARNERFRVGAPATPIRANLTALSFHQRTSSSSEESLDSRCSADISYSPKCFPAPSFTFIDLGLLYTAHASESPTYVFLTLPFSDFVIFRPYRSLLAFGYRVFHLHLTPLTLTTLQIR